jgi:hypothetical protein
MLPLRVRVRAKLDGIGKDINAYALKVVRVNVTLDDYKPYLSIYLFKNRIYKTRLRKKKETNNTMLWLKSADVSSVKANVYYGLKSPFSTALASGAIGIVSGFVKIDELNMHPDFLAESDYFKINASAEIMLGNTICNFVKNKRNEARRNKEWSKA